MKDQEIMQFTLPLAIGITNKHWVLVFRAHLAWARARQEISDNDYSLAVKQLDTFSSGTPEPSFDNFRIRAIAVLPAKASDVLSKIPEKLAFHFARTLVIKDNNDVTLKKYYQYRNIVRDVAYQYKDVAQKLDGKVTTVGYQFALAYSNLRVILESFVLSRRYLETINNGNNLSDFSQDYSLDKLDFIAKELELFNVSPFSSSNQNWFVSNAKDLANLSKGVIRYIKQLIAKGQAGDVDNSLLTQSEGSADSVIAYSVKEFAIDFDTYSSLFTQTHSAFSGVIRILRAIKFSIDSIEKEVSEGEKGQIRTAVVELFKRIFDGERKREVFDQIFFEASEVDNMIYRLAQQINNEYRDSTKPVCCVGFTEGCVILMGKVFPLLNFPCHLVTDKLSFYGAATSGDESKDVEIEFDNSKYDGKRVIIFDDILDRGITVKKFLEQARRKTKAVDFKVCMLFVKPNPENVFGDADFLGSMCPNVWVVGYGFDTLYKHRNADAVGSIKESFKSE